VFAGLVVATMSALVLTAARLIGADGLTAGEMLLLALFALTTPWLAIGLWNTLIGFAVLHGVRDPLARVLPIAEPVADGQAAATAIAFPIRNEAPARIFARLRTILEGLDRTGAAAGFEAFVLSDTNDDAIAAEEARLFADLCRNVPGAIPVHYRRRRRNTGYKAGNLQDFCEMYGGRFEFMIVLDADSLMSGRLLVRLVRQMQANPRLGILQTLIVGLPATSPFTRIFQFGMRHGMRVYTIGSAWWQGDCGPYWGHNAIIRVEPFLRHCRLPVLPGRPPLGGHLLSHDQVEAVLMRAAGYEVRVVPVEDDSYEENPPTLLDFRKRDLRWCQGNLQYLRLLGRRGIRPMGRLQLLLAIMMYTASPLWPALLLIGLGQIATGPALAASDGIAAAPAGIVLGLFLYAAVVIGALAPQVLGVVGSLASAAGRAGFGGGWRLVAGMAMEAVYALLLTPILAVSQTVFVVGLMFGRTSNWQPQRRDVRTIGAAAATRALWPHTVLGLGATVLLALKAPGVLPWIAPVLVAWLLAIPFASLSTSERLGRAFVRIRLCGIPEEFRTPAEVGGLLRPATTASAAVSAPVAPAPAP
jgi:membrane glycosyltransferase